MRRLGFTLSLLLVFAMLYYAVSAMTWAQNPGVINERPGSPDTAPQLNLATSETVSAQNGDKGRNVMTNITITVNDTAFSAKIYETSAARALLAQFPMTLNMSDLNGNEKYYRLAKKLPAESTERPATIKAGDIMCWSGDTLVLFYKTFANSYGGYVRLGYVEDVSGFAAALGSGSVKVSFAICD